MYGHVNKNSKKIGPPNHQEFQVPKMEVLNLIRLFWWVGFSVSISRIHTVYIGEDEPSILRYQRNVW